MGRIIIGCIIACVALSCLIISIRQFKRKGFLLNNAYLYASKTEREKMNKEPHYRQSGIVFAFLAGIFSFLAIEIVSGATWLSYPIGILTVGVIAYAIVSSVQMEKSGK